MEKNARQGARRCEPEKTCEKFCEEFKQKVVLCRKPILELNLNLGPRLGSRIRQSLLRVGSSLPENHTVIPWPYIASRKISRASATRGRLDLVLLQPGTVRTDHAFHRAHGRVIHDPVDRAFSGLLVFLRDGPQAARALSRSSHGRSPPSRAASGTAHGCAGISGTPLFPGRASPALVQRVGEHRGRLFLSEARVLDRVQHPPVVDLGICAR